MVRIENLKASAPVERALAELLIEAVADNAGVSFLYPLSQDKAQAFWRASLACAERGERILFGAFEDGALVGTVTLNLDCPENQPHRGEIAKMIVAKRARRKGIAGQLLIAAETTAKERAKTLLTLDAVPGQAGERLYLRHGFIRVGEIPDYALQPDRSFTATAIFYKRLADSLTPLKAGIAQVE